VSLLRKLPLPPADKTGWPWTEETTTSVYREKEEWPKISIVTPSYNQGQFIEETIRSVLLQNYPNLEYIIIDGGSTDETIEIIKKYESWFTYWISEPDKGQSHAINKGFSKASGKWLSWLNSDDMLTRNSLWNIFSHNDLIINKEVIISSGLITDKDLNTKHIKPAFPLDFNKLISWGAVPNQPSVLFSRNIYEKAGRINEGHHYTMDWRLWLDISDKINESNQLIINEYSLGVSRVWQGMKTNTGTATKGYQEVRKAIVEYSQKKEIQNLDVVLKKAYDKKQIFIKSKREKVKHLVYGFLKFRSFSYIRLLIKELL